MIPPFWGCDKPAHPVTSQEGKVTGLLPESRPFSQQRSHLKPLALKAAPSDGRLFPESYGDTATLSAAQALANRLLPHRKQAIICLRNIQELTFL